MIINSIIIMLLYILVYSGIFKFKISIVIINIIISIIIGMLLSSIFFYQNIYLYIDCYVLLLIPIFLLLYFFVDTHYLCLSYAYPIYFCIIEILRLDTYTDVSSFIFLIGMMHMAEGMLLIIHALLFTNIKDTVETYDIEFDFKGNRIKCKTFYSLLWIIPLIIPVITNKTLYMYLEKNNVPVNNIIGENNLNMFYTMIFILVTYKYAKIRSNTKSKDGFKIILYAVVVIILSIIDINVNLWNHCLIIIQCALHEIMINY